MKRWWIWMGVIAGCGPVVGGAEDGATDDDTTGGGSTTVSATTAPVTTTGGTTVGSTTDTTTSTVTTVTTAVTDPTTEGEDECGEECCAFLCEPDGGWGDADCDLWAQDCPRGDKCMPWANDGGAIWTATRCSPLDAAPGGVGEPCHVEGSGVSGFDDCALGSMCWGVDPDTNEGTCVGFCEGSEANPQCPDGLACFIGFEGALVLCLPPCDPLAPECGADACVFDEYSGDFWCVPALHVGETYYGEPCGDTPFACGSDYVCVSGENVANCEGHCCTTICDPAAPNTCPEAEFGQTCLPLGEIGYCGT